MSSPSAFEPIADGAAVARPAAIFDAIDPKRVDAGDRLRALDPDWVALLADEIVLDGQITPIHVVARGSRYLLIEGARRLAAVLRIGGTIEARIEPEASFADAASVRLAEIKANLMRGELTVLDRSYYIAAWRDLYLSFHKPKRGRKPKMKIGVQRTPITAGAQDAANDDAPDGFVLSLSDAAQQALQISKKTLYRHLQIAGIARSQGHRLVGHPSADSRTELLLLSEQAPARHAPIIDLILGDNARIGTVAEAIAHLDGAAAAPKLSPPERFHQTFSRLRPQDQEAFFELNVDAIERWAAGRSGMARRTTVRGAA